MRTHVAACPDCAGGDARLRRVLLAARNSPAIEPSEDFSRRLRQRIAVERARGRATAYAPPVWRRRLAATAAVVAMLAGGAGVSVFAALRAYPTPVLAHAPVVVTPPALPAEPVAAPAMFATVGSGFPVYPAMLMAQRATAFFAATHARTLIFQAER